MTVPRKELLLALREARMALGQKADYSHAHIERGMAADRVAFWAFRGLEANRTAAILMAHTLDLEGR